MLEGTLAEVKPVHRGDDYKGDDYDQLFEQLREAATNELCVEVQQELARLIAVTRRCRNIDNSDKCVRELKIALNALLKPKPANLELAGSSICIVEIQSMRCQNGFPKWLVEKSKASPIMATNIGLFFASIIWAFFSILCYYLIMSNGDTLAAVQSPQGSLLTVASCAFLGGIASMFMKVNDHARMTKVDLSLLFWTGLFKPFVGLLLGCVLFALVQTALAGFGSASVQTSDPQKYFYFLIVIGFVAGFSERFAADAITRAAPVLGGGSGK